MNDRERMEATINMFRPRTDPVMFGESYWKEELRMAEQDMEEWEAEQDRLMVRRVDIESRIRTAQRKLGIARREGER